MTADKNVEPVTRALARGLEVFEALAIASEDGLGPTAIADAVELDKATVSRLLQTLIQMGYVSRTEETRRYRPTSKILRIAQAVSARIDLLSTARPHLRRLRDDLNETVHLGVMEDLWVVYLDKLESTNTIQLVSAIGQTQPLHSTSLGKAMLSALPDAALEATLARMDFARRTERTICSVDEFREEILRIRQRGFATDDRENEPLTACVAAPVVGARLHPVAAVSVAGPHFRIRDHFQKFGERTRATAADIARDLGG